MNRLLKLGTLLAGLVAGGAIAAAQSLSAPKPSSPAAAAAGERRDQDERRRRDQDKQERRRRIIKIAKLFAVFLAVLGFGGLLVATSGIIPIKASSGHWRITAWFLDFAKGRSVSTNTLGLTAPRLDQPWLVLKGAGHFEFGCRPCHGSPDLPQPRIAWRMTPPPPNLAPEVGQWENSELFYIVKHGIKFTGMPAWPSQQRDDEVWAMVAFLRKLPELPADEYRRLVQGEAAPSGEAAPLPDLVGPESVRRALTTSCARCHGLDGRGRGLDAFPQLAGQHPDYLDRSLQAFARGQRHSGIMEPIAAGLSQEEMHELARYYASLPASAPSSQQATPASERGRVIAQQGIPSQRVPACAACHGPAPTPRNPLYPELAGQYADYLALQLEIFKQGKRGGTEYAHIMRQAAAGLTAEQMRDVAHYYAALERARK